MICSVEVDAMAILLDTKSVLTVLMSNKLQSIKRLGLGLGELSGPWGAYYVQSELNPMGWHGHLFLIMSSRCASTFRSAILGYHYGYPNV